MYIVNVTAHQQRNMVRKPQFFGGCRARVPCTTGAAGQNRSLNENILFIVILYIA